jgi:site-specific DNA-methyltransferase (adenine-specific)
MDRVLLSTGKDDYGTPWDFFNELNKEFGFTLDPCATPENAKCSKFYTKEQDGLGKNWGGR